MKSCALFCYPRLRIAAASWLFWCTACGDTQLTRPTEPTPLDRTAHSVTGTWTGTYRVTGCRANFSVLPCSYFASEPFLPGGAHSMQIVLAQTGAIVSGTVDTDIMNAFSSKSFPVSGMIDSSGTLRLQGSQPFIPGCFGDHQNGIDIG